MEIVGVIPAAGHALRLQPLVGSKEMLESGGSPIMDSLVECMRARVAARGSAERIDRLRREGRAVRGVVGSDA
ncbi:MAG: hypothetical protein M3Q67_01535 [Actinomycetota bacterium]|nr:hypothetical protein [Actinomycetota bacterium]